MLKKSLEAARGAYLDAKVVCKRPIESALPPTSGTCVWAMGCGGAAGGLIGSLAGWLVDWDDVTGASSTGALRLAA